VQLVGSVISPTSGPLTLIRTRGLLTLLLTGATSAGDGFQGAFGIGRVTSAALDVGIGSVPSPIAELAWDGWLYHTFFSCHAQDTSLRGGIAQAMQIVIDSKAMRKFDVQEDIYAAIESVEIGTAAMSVFFDSRMLFQTR